MMADWMLEGIGANDRDEQRTEKLHAERHDLPHPHECRCLPCSIDHSGLQPGTYGDEG